VPHISKMAVAAILKKVKSLGLYLVTA